MSTEQQDNPNPEWRKELRSMGESPAPPAWLEQRVVDALRARGLLRRTSGAQVRWLWPMAAAAACALCFFAGLFFPRWRHAPAPGDTQPQYVLLLFRGADMPAPSTQEEAGLVREYSGWVRQERAAGHLLGGEKLNDASAAISSPQGQPVEADNQLGGYFVITAPDLEGALAIARSCPHLKHGGTIVVRPIDQT